MADITSNLVGWWKLDEGSGSTAIDSSGNGNNGTIYSSPSYVTGEIGPYALNLDGSTQYVDCLNPSSLQITGNITMSAWINISSFPAGGNWGTIVEKGYDGSVEGYLMRINGTGTSIQIGSYNGNDSATVWPITFGTGTWHLITGVYDGSSWILYVDGSQVSSTISATGAISTTANFYIGKMSMGRFFSGTEDDVRIYNRALSSTDVAALYAYTGSSGTTTNQTVAVTGSTTAGLSTAKTILQAISATGTAIAQSGLVKSFLKTLGSTVTGVTALIKSLSKTINTTATGTSSLLKSISKTVSTVATGTVVIVTAKIIIKALSVTQTATVGVVKSIGKIVSATATNVTNISTIKSFIKTIATSVTSVTTLKKGLSKTLSTTVTSIANVITSFIAGISILDSYNETHFDGSSPVSTFGPYAGQSFTNTNPATLDSAKFYISRYGSPTGSIYAQLYAHTGTYGTSSVPTGSALATSDAINVTTISTTNSLVTFNFTSANRISLSAGTYYCIVLYFAGGSAGNYINYGQDNNTGAAPSASGNSFISANGTSWSPSSNDDIFYVYGIITGSVISKAINVVGSVASNISIAIGKLIGTTATNVTNVTKAFTFNKILASTVTGTVSLIKGLSKSISATGTAIISVSQIKAITKAITATVTGTSNIIKGLSKTLSVSATGVTSLTKGLSKTISTVATSISSVGTSIIAIASQAINAIATAIASVTTKNGIQLGLVSYWKLSDTSDSVGSNTLTNTNSVTFTTGKIGNAATFVAASSQSLNAGNPASLQITGAISFSFWVKLTAYNGAGVYAMITKSDDSSQRSFAIYQVSSNLAIQFSSSGNGSNVYTATGAVITDNNYHHIVVTFDPSGPTGHLYVDGINKDSSVSWASGGWSGTTIFNSSSSFYIGSKQGGTWFMGGQIDETGIWSRALSADEVSQLFNSGRGNAFPLTVKPSLYGGIAYYTLDGNSTDATGSGHTGTDTAITYNNSYGIINQGALFDGSISRIALPNLGGSAGTAFSISMWLNEASLSSYLKEVFSFGDNTGSYGICECVLNYPTSGTVYFGFNTVYYTATSAFTAYAWHHVVWIYSGGATSISTVKVYIDGSALTLTQSGTPGTPAISNTNYAIGYSSLFSGRNWNGNIDEVGIWSRALTSTEVTVLYNSGSGKQWPWAGSAIAQAINAVVTTTAGVVKSVGKTLSVTTTGTANMIKGVAKTLSATVTGTAKVVKGFAKTLASTVTGTATILASRAYLLTLNAIVTGTANVSKIVGKLINVTSTVNASINTISSLFRTLVDTITHSDVILSSRQVIRAIADSLLNSASRFATVIGGKAVFRQLTDSIANAVSRLITVAINNVLTRTLHDDIMNGAGRVITLITSIFSGFAPKVSLKSIISLLKISKKDSKLIVKTDKNDTPKLKINK